MIRLSPIQLDIVWLLDDACRTLDKLFRNGKLSAQNYIEFVDFVHNGGSIERLLEMPAIKALHETQTED